MSKYLHIITIIFITIIIILPSQLHNGFLDGDMFYHIQITKVLFEQGFINSLPWLPFTSLSNNFADHHYLYHVILYPFITIFGDFLGAKILHIISISLISIGIYLFLKKYTKHALIFSLLPLSSVIFLLRIEIQKTSALAVAYSILCLYLIIEKHYKWLILASFLYVHLYGGWPLIITFAAIYILSNAMYTGKFKSIIALENFKLIGSIILGLIFGLIINPYFPNNLKFYYEQIYQIAILNPSYIIASEWIGYGSLNIFISYSTLIFILFVGIIVSIILHHKKINKTQLFLFLITIALFILTIKSRRYIEYFIPYSAILTGLIIPNLIKGKIKKNLNRILIILFIIFTSIGFISQYKMLTQNPNPEYFSYNIYKDASKWLENNTKKDEIIFHTLWEEFPMLFYYNKHNRYISGLDPRFLFFKDDYLAYKYYSICKIQNSEEIYSIIKNDFNSNYILINHQIEQNKNILKTIDNSKLFYLIYNDNNIKIYRLNKTSF